MESLIKRIRIEVDLRGMESWESWLNRRSDKVTTWWKDLLFFIADKYKYLNTSEGRTVEYAHNCIISLNLFVYNFVVLFNDILDSFAEGNEFL